MQAAYLSTAYLAPVQYYSLLTAFDEIYLETDENYPKQTYRNRCQIASANGIQTLTVPVEKPATIKTLTRDIRISNHGNWRHLHWNAFVSAYNLSPFFEYYADDFRPYYEKKYTFLLDYNEALRTMICSLLDIHPTVIPTTKYTPFVENDFRQSIPPHPLPVPSANFHHSLHRYADVPPTTVHHHLPGCADVPSANVRHSLPDGQSSPRPYYQVFRAKHGFLPNLSIIDLLFNMGPESILYL